MKDLNAFQHLDIQRQARQSLRRHQLRHDQHPQAGLRARSCRLDSPG